MYMKMKSNQLHVSCLVYTVIFSALWNFSSTAILLSWYIKQAKLKENCSKTLRLIELKLSTQKVHQVEANLHQEVMQAEAPSPAQMVVHIQMPVVFLVAKSWMLQVRRTNLQVHHLAQ